MNNNKLLSNCQYGFRQNHSAYLAILDMYDSITNAFEKGEFAIGVFIDLSKAFDTINHDILCRKLELYGVRGTPLSWFRDYLSNRSQYVTLNNVSSDLQNITCGVPQGSILGPLLFLIYVNDIVKCSQILQFILFADDTNLFYSSNCIDELLCTVNYELNNLCNWFKANKLSLNIDKTKFILFGRKGKK